MSSNSNRALMLVGVGVALFGISTLVLTRVISGPHTERDYFIIGCLATLLTLAVMFLIVISTWTKTPNPFFKRRRR
jgi:hypothetical protein